MVKTYRIRTLSRAELAALAIEWAASEGWNPGWQDAACFHAADPEGFLVGELDGEPIASISAVRYGTGFGFIGLYIVKPGYRGQGYGWQIWQAGMDHLAGRCIGLDGVLAQQANYARSGFVLAHRNVRYEGKGGGQREEGDGGAQADAPAIVALSTLPFEAIERYDQPFFPERRTAFLQAWLQQPGAHALGFLREGQLAGYGVLRPCRTGHKVGPLFADDPLVAEALFSSLLARAEPGSPVYLDIPEPNAAAVALVERHGMAAMFETARMYTGTAPGLPLDRMFGITSFELG